MLVSVWFDRPQFPPSTIRKKNKSKKKIPIDIYETDLEKTEKILPPAPKKPRNLKQVNIIS